jgi:hypothetical protein
VRRGLGLGTALIALCVAGCGSQSGDGKKESDAAQQSGKGRFSNPTRIDNPYFPLKSGTKYTWGGTEYQDGEKVTHHVVFVVTDLTKTIDGVRTRVVWDRDFADGRLSEGELAFDAQDDAGNVWSYGEYPEEFEPKKPPVAPATWFPGLAGAKPGILMLAAPRPGGASYLQGLAPKIQFADRGRVTKKLKRMCVPAGCYKDVIVIEEWTPEEPGAKQLKYHAPGIGTIRVGFESGAQRESLALERVEQLDAGDLAQVHKQVQAIDKRGYQVKPNLYGRTPRVR